MFLFRKGNKGEIFRILAKTSVLLVEIVIFAGERKDTIMLNPTNTQGIYLNVPMTDWVLLKELIRKFGWQAETREQLLERFVKSRSNKDLLSDEEIMEEVNAVRYEK